MSSSATLHLNYKGLALEEIDFLLGLSITLVGLGARHRRFILLVLMWHEIDESHLTAFALELSRGRPLQQAAFGAGTAFRNRPTSRASSPM
jgi:hypothetical protein